MTGLAGEPSLDWPGRIAIALLIGLIRVYQYTLSPLLGNVCRFEPSCSRYMVEALRKYGLIRGLAQGSAAGSRAAIPGTPGATIRRERRGSHLFARPERLTVKQGDPVMRPALRRRRLPQHERPGTHGTSKPRSHLPGSGR